MGRDLVDEATIEGEVVGVPGAARHEHTTDRCLVMVVSALVLPSRRGERLRSCGDVGTGFALRLYPADQGQFLQKLPLVTG